MSAPKTGNSWGFMAKVETTYGTNPTLAGAADGVILAEKPDPDFGKYLHDGSRGTVPGGAPRQRVNQSGRWGSMGLNAEAIGAAAAYSAAVFPSIHTLLRSCGLEPTGTFGGGTEVWRYSPETGPTGLESITIQAYLSGQLYELNAAYGDFEVSVDGPGVPMWVFNYSGTATVQTDVAIPAITYPPATRLPPKAESIALTIGTWTGAIVRGFNFKSGREHEAARADLNGNASTAHKGFTPGGRSATLEVTVERVALATTGPWHTATTINPFMLKELGTMIICSLQVGSAQYNRWKLFAGSPTTAAQAQIVEVKEDYDGPTATWVLTLEFKPSTYVANDEYTISFD